MAVCVRENARELLGDVELDNDAAIGEIDGACDGVTDGEAGKDTDIRALHVTEGLEDNDSSAVVVAVDEATGVSVPAAVTDALLVCDAVDVAKADSV